MSLARFFTKPRWQSKDESVRRAAVAADKEPELIEALPRLAREDTGTTDQPDPSKLTRALAEAQVEATWSIGFLR